MTIKQIVPDLAPFHLLLLAYPSVQRIQKYLPDSIVFIGEHSDTAVAVAVCKLCDDEFELHNICVSESHQGHGFGSQMLTHIFTVAKRLGAICVTVGTGNSSLKQLSFYQKAGFRISTVIPNYFIDDHPQIFEHGIRCIDMIRLRYDTRA